MNLIIKTIKYKRKSLHNHTSLLFNTFYIYSGKKTVMEVCVKAGHIHVKF